MHRAKDVTLILLRYFLVFRIINALLSALPERCLGTLKNYYTFVFCTKARTRSNPLNCQKAVVSLASSWVPPWTSLREEKAETGSRKLISKFRTCLILHSNPFCGIFKGTQFSQRPTYLSKQTDRQNKQKYSFAPLCLHF